MEAGVIAVGDMCPHIPNVQVTIRSARNPGLVMWFDCPLCYEARFPGRRFEPFPQTEDPNPADAAVVTMACKACKKVFKKDMSHFEEADEYCPRCGNHFVLTAELPEDYNAQLHEIAEQQKKK